MKLENLKICKSLLSKTRGMMFRKDFEGVMLFVFNKEEYVPLHMWFVFFPIDVFFLDENQKVIEIKRNFKPWRYYSPKNKSKYVLEAKKGKVKINLGDFLEW